MQVIINFEFNYYFGLVLFRKPIYVPHKYIQYMKNVNIFGWIIQIISAFVHMQTVQKALLAMLQMWECACINYVNIIFLAVITFEYFIGVCIISLCTADMMCVHFLHPK